jgi:hypothetical protein
MPLHTLIVRADAARMDAIVSAVLSVCPEADTFERTAALVDPVAARTVGRVADTLPRHRWDALRREQEGR